MLKYIGNGAFIAGIPARDLSNEEAETYAKDLEWDGKRGIEGLLATGLYMDESASVSSQKDTARSSKKKEA